MLTAVCLPRSALAIAAGWLAMLPGAAWAESPVPPARCTLSQWVVDLGSRDYRARATATRCLRNAESCETVAVLESAAWSDPEVAARGLRILRHLAASEDEDVRLRAQAALEILTRLSDERLAARARQLLAEARRGLLTLIETAGGTVEFADRQGECIAGIHLQRCPGAASLLRRMKGVETLERLNLASCEVTDESLQRLPELTTLKYLCVQSNPITDAGLEQIVKLHGLEALYLSSTKITDQGIERLRGQTALRVLWLNYTEVGDAAVDVLAALKQLKHLRITGTRISDAGLARLERALPETRITR